MRARTSPMVDRGTPAMDARRLGSEGVLMAGRQDRIYLRPGQGSWRVGWKRAPTPSLGRLWLVNNPFVNHG